MGEGLCTLAGAGEGLPRESGASGQHGGFPFPQSPFWALGAAGLCLGRCPRELGKD